MGIRISLLSVVAIVLCCATGANAGTVPLGDLIDNGGEVVVGDKIFDEFGYTATGDMPVAAEINVTDHVDLEGNYGLRFQGGFTDLFGGGASDALITFRVRVADGSLLEITDAHLQGNPDVIGHNGEQGFISVTETFSEASNTMSIYDIIPGNSKLVDWTYFDQTFTELHVQKNILAYAGSDGVVATLSFVDQTFSQVPEPGALVLLGIFGLAAVAMRRKLG